LEEVKNTVERKCSKLSSTQRLLPVAALRQAEVLQAQKIEFKGTVSKTATETTPTVY